MKGINDVYTILAIHALVYCRYLSQTNTLPTHYELTYILSFVYFFICLSNVASLIKHILASSSCLF